MNVPSIFSMHNITFMMWYWLRTHPVLLRARNRLSASFILKFVHNTARFWIKNIVNGERICFKNFFINSAVQNQKKKKKISCADITYGYNTNIHQAMVCISWMKLPLEFGAFAYHISLFAYCLYLQYWI